MDKIKLIKKHLDGEKRLLLKAIDSAKETRDSAPSAMESHHDTTRNQAEKLVVAFEEKLHNLEKVILSIPGKENVKPATKTSLWSYVEIKLNENIMKLIIVPGGIGGKEVVGIKLVSLKSPLGKAFVGKSSGDTFKFNNQKGKILKVE